MFEYIAADKSANMDLNMYQCGFEDCAPGHFYGPAVRDHFLVHYIITGINYSRRLSVAEIAGYVGLDRSYFV